MESLSGASAESRPFRDGLFDLIFAGEVLEHLLYPMQALREWIRILDSKGTMVLSIPNGILVGPVGGNPEHKATYAPKAVICTLEKPGMKTVGSKAIFTGACIREETFHSNSLLVAESSTP